MEDHGEGEMNLDLNLGPLSPASGGSAPGNGTASLLEENISLNDSVGIHRRYREALRQRTRQIWRRRGWGNSHAPLETQVTSAELMVDSGAAADPVAVGHNINGTMHAGEGSNDSDVRSDELTKACENIVTQPEDETADSKKDIEKGITGDASSFFDCNICLDSAKEPIVTSCGHLFCWPCLYRWLNIHSDAKECPVCKGEVTVKTVTPIFGKGDDGTPNTVEDHGVKIPERPPARRVESLRQAIQRTALSIPMEEMIRRLGMRFDHTRDSLQDPHVLERSAVLLNRILTSRGMRREQNVVVPSDGEDLNLESEETRAFSHLFHRRSQSYRGSPPAAAPPSGASADRFVETVIRTPSVDDRDSISSITAAIHGESQTLDTAAEIDSTVSLSTSSSRRRNDAPRISDMDSGDSPMPRRRRIN